MTIILSKSKKIWITSDTHFGHLNIIAYTRRPFFKNGYSMNDLNDCLDGYSNTNDFSEIVDLNLHDNILIDNWNSKISSKDLVYHLGDFGFGNVENILKKLNGNIILIKGNHDTRIDSYKKYFNYFIEEGALNRTVHFNGEKVILCHYPMLSWNASFHGRVHFFGHVHSSPLKSFKCAKNSYDVGVDNNNFTPLSCEEAIYLAKNNKNVFEFQE